MNKIEAGRRIPSFAILLILSILSNRTNNRPLVLHRDYAGANS